MCVCYSVDISYFVHFFYSKTRDLNLKDNLRVVCAFLYFRNANMNSILTSHCVLKTQYALTDFCYNDDDFSPGSIFVY